MAEVLFNIVIFVFFVLIIKGFIKENTEGSNQESFSKEGFKTLLGLETGKPDQNDSRDFMKNFREKYQTTGKGGHTQSRTEKKQRNAFQKIRDYKIKVAETFHTTNSEKVRKTLLMKAWSKSSNIKLNTVRLPLKKRPLKT